VSSARATRRANEPNAPAPAGRAGSSLQTVEHLLRKHRDALLEKWIEAVLSVYPPETAKVLRRSKDPLQNPVGTTLFEELDRLLEALLEGAPDEVLRPPLDEILKVRSVQGFSPSAAVSFVFRLKDIAREAVGAPQRRGPDPAAVHEFEARVERLGLMAFDSYVQFREELYELRVQEAKRQVSWWLRKLGMADDDVPSPVARQTKPTAGG